MLHTWLFISTLPTEPSLLSPPSLQKKKKKSPTVAQASFNCDSLLYLPRQGLLVNFLMYKIQMYWDFNAFPLW